MHFTTFLLAAIAPFALASPIEQRDTTSLVNAITNIDTKVNTLTATVNTFGPNQLGTALKIQGQTLDVGNAVDAATKLAKKSPVLSLDDSYTVGIPILTTLQPDISTLLNSLVAHQNAFQNVLPLVGNFDFLVKFDLQQQQQKADAFGTAILAILDPSLQPIAQNTISSIDAAFTSAIATFSS